MHVFVIADALATPAEWFFIKVVVLAAFYGWIVGPACLILAWLLRRTRHAFSGVLLVFLLVAGSVLLPVSLVVHGFIH